MSKKDRTVVGEEDVTFSKKQINSMVLQDKMELKEKFSSGGDCKVIDQMEKFDTPFETCATRFTPECTSEMKKKCIDDKDWSCKKYYQEIGNGTNPLHETREFSFSTENFPLDPEEDPEKKNED